MNRITKLLCLICLLIVACLFATGCVGGEKYAENGLEYVVNKDGKTCTIVGMGNCTDTVVVVPKSISGYRVTVIGKDAFCGGKGGEVYGEITEVVLPEGLLSIEDSAFAAAEKLTKVNIPSTVTKIGECAFEHCISLKSIVLPKGVTEMGTQIFMGCVLLEEFVIPDGVEIIGSAAFMGCSSLRSVSLPESVRVIKEGAFAATAIETLTFGSNLESIGSMAVHFCENLTDIYYNGTRAEWQKVSAEGWAKGDETFHCTDAVFSTSEFYQ